MERVVQVTAARLHERAAHCRELARLAISEAIAAELRSIAEDYDCDAERLESHGTFSSPSRPKLRHG
ncbi:MAG TPA: hypothetical protein VMQ11_02625 [Alphaproteobacteria bacterium]|nr:hypothetical protein [Alphaproteobacteria bacterium]